VTGQEPGYGQDARAKEVAGTPALSASVVAALAEEGLTVEDYAGQFSADGVWYGDACGCSDDRCSGFHHDAASNCGCFPVLLEQALDSPALAARLSAEQTEADAYQAVQDEQRSHAAWQASDGLAVDATAGHAAELDTELGEVGL
jgi:hypothetical protein